MTDEQIEKALECCTTWNGCRNECPYDSKCDGIFDCATRLAQDALALIKRLKKQLVEQMLTVDEECDKCIAEARAEAIQEFAERLKGCIFERDDELIDEIARQMTEEQK